MNFIFESNTAEAQLREKICPKYVGLSAIHAYVDIHLYVLSSLHFTERF